MAFKYLLFLFFITGPLNCLTMELEDMDVEWVPIEDTPEISDEMLADIFKNGSHHDIHRFCKLCNLMISSIVPAEYNADVSVDPAKVLKAQIKHAKSHNRSYRIDLLRLLGSCFTTSVINCDMCNVPVPLSGLQSHRNLHFTPSKIRCPHDACNHLIAVSTFQSYHHKNAHGVTVPKCNNCHRFVIKLRNDYTLACFKNLPDEIKYQLNGKQVN